MLQNSLLQKKSASKFNRLLTSSKYNQRAPKILNQKTKRKKDQLVGLIKRAIKIKLLHQFLLGQWGYYRTFKNIHHLHYYIYIYIYIRPHPLIFLLPISYNTFSRSFQNFELTKLTVKTFIRSLFFFFFFLFLSLCNKVVLFYIPLSFRCYYNTCSSYICYCLFGLYFIWVRLIFLGK